MNFYMNALWGCAGLAITLLGITVWKRKLFGVAICPGKASIEDKDKFVEVYGKDIVFLGVMTIISSAVCTGDSSYITAAIAINVLAVVYFVLEVFHLSRRFAK